jgi:hypothetical protein
VERNGDLFEVILALRAACRFASRLHSGQKQAHEHADDRNDNEQLHQRKGAPSGPIQVIRGVHGMISDKQ